MNTEVPEWESPESVKPQLKQLKLEDPTEMKPQLQFDPSMESHKGNHCLKCFIRSSVECLFFDS